MSSEEEELPLPKLCIMQTCPIDFGECKKIDEIEKEFNPSQVFMDIPYSGYKKEYEEAIKKVIKSFELTPVLAEKSKKAEGLLCNVCQTIQKSGYAVADISRQKLSKSNYYERNPNVLFELGISLTLGKKTCIICNSRTKIPVDLGGIVVNKYKNSGEIEKNVSKWIADNVSDIAIRIAKQRKIFNFIFYQIEHSELNEIPKLIEEIKMIGDIHILTNEFNRLFRELCYFLKNNDSWIRGRAVIALGHIGDNKAVEPLVNALSDNDHYVRVWAAEALIENNQVAVSLITAFHNENPEIRLSAAKALIEISTSQAVLPLISLLNDPDLEIQEMAINSLGKIGGKNAVDSLIGILRNEKSSMRIASIKALGNIGDIKSVGFLIEILRDKDFVIRGEAAKALGRIGDEKAIEPLIAALKYGIYDISIEIINSLCEISKGKASQSLIDALEDKDSEVRATAAGALGEIGDIKALEPLINGLKDEDSHVRAEAAEALGKIGDKKALEPLSNLFDDYEKPVFLYETTVSDIAEEATDKIKFAHKDKKK